MNTDISLAQVVEIIGMDMALHALHGVAVVEELLYPNHLGHRFGEQLLKAK